MSTTHKHVQNIVANELGITRESVLEIIDSRIKKLLIEPNIEHVIDRAVVRVLSDSVKEHRHDHASIRGLIKDAAVNLLRERLILTIKEPGNG